MEKATQLHNIPPLYDKSSRVLILGSFPSVKSREAAFFYAHPQNRFWPTLAAVLDEATPKTVEDKRSLVLRHGIALWDTIGCNGGTSYASYNKYCRAMTGREAAKLPSTSPANARWTQDKLLHAWREALLPYLSEV